ncbi:hypothetical protein [Aurantibacillus circumpalustris]|uniref:hypothetical protein n=1 Tax=Aurantibacillus circumpalustris TaxID=3036359 RepID=UPI00295B053D|nr:hypothetical protein [Aurantibacillus circumpalustris]
MIKYFTILPFFILFSCASLHTPSPHFTPTITKKNQFEGEASFGYGPASVSAAYAPLNHLTILGNVQALVLTKNAGFHQRNAELGIGTYGSCRKLIYGFNAGYGLGSYNWNYNQFNDSTTYSILTNGSFQKLMIQSFIAITDDATDPGWYAGISLKGNYYWDQYTTLRNSTQQANDFNGLEKNMSFEPCLFVRDFFTNRFYLNMQAGMNISYDHTMFWPTQYLFFRLGIGIKLNGETN